MKISKSVSPLKSAIDDRSGDNVNRHLPTDPLLTMDRSAIHKTIFWSPLSKVAKFTHDTHANITSYANKAYKPDDKVKNMKIRLFPNHIF